MLDFSKAFDMVAHNRLLYILNFYGIIIGTIKVHKWLTTWLTQRTQRVVLDGSSSNYVNIESGVPQGTVLEPLMLLLYVNDISAEINSSLRLFADDYVLYRIIKSDKLHLQSDLNLISRWFKSWQMLFNV